jgi:hypothetical protein
VNPHRISYYMSNTFFGFSERQLVPIYVKLILLVGMVFIVGLYSVPSASAQHMMMPPAASIGDRKIMSNFEIAPKAIHVGQNALMKISFDDQNTKQKIYHVTVRMDISKDGKHIFSEFFHSHDGMLNVNFRQVGNTGSSPLGHTIGGNFDDLTNAWISDPGSPVIVNGPVFLKPGNYKLVLEVTTLDNDKTDLTQPLKYEYNIPVA